MNPQHLTTQEFLSRFLGKTNVLKPNEEQRKLYDDADCKMWQNKRLEFMSITDKNRSDSERLPVLVHFFGGGFCTGVPLDRLFRQPSIRQLQCHAVSLIPLYPLMPGAHGDTILEYLKDLWTAWREPEFRDRLNKLYPNIKIDNVAVSGQSAGGLLASYSDLLHPKITFKAVFSQYPICLPYTRSAVQPHLGVKLDIDHKDFSMQVILFLIKNHRHHHSQNSRIPPTGMDLCYIMASTMFLVIRDSRGPHLVSIWTFWNTCQSIPEAISGDYDRIPRHKTVVLETQEIMDKLLEKGKKNLDEMGVTHNVQLEALSYTQTNLCVPPCLSDTLHFYYHGSDDENCPVKETFVFRDSLLERAPEKKIYIHQEQGRQQSFDTESLENNSELKDFISRMEKE